MSKTSKEVKAIKVHQWQKEWERVNYKKPHRKQPEQFFYLFSLRASVLKLLTGINRRSIQGGLKRSQDLGIQRRHDETRSKEIGQYIHYGYPWSELSVARRKSGEFDDLRMPGWLPTAIVINILKPDDVRHGAKVAKTDLITVTDEDNSTALIKLPNSFNETLWTKTEGCPYPIEVIDGQHRLWAFENGSRAGDFELPVVAFYGLDHTWQAYLFWTINIKPKRINASLAFDLYPLLRTEEWLEKFEGPAVYRETRSQELTEALWGHLSSPWHHRINMLGERGQGTVSQAAWIRSLMATYVKSFEGRGIKIGGLFGSRVGNDQEVLPWSRIQQGAFLIFVWQEIQKSINECKEPWAVSLRETSSKKLFDTKEDPAFSGSKSLLNSDVGVRAILFITNDLCFVRAKALKLDSIWTQEQNAGADDDKALTEALKQLLSSPTKRVVSFIKELAKELCRYDWREASFGGLSEDQKTAKLAFRGSGGYRELRRQLLKQLAGKPNTEVGKAAQDVIKILRFS